MKKKNKKIFVRVTHQQNSYRNQISFNEHNYILILVNHFFTYNKKFFVYSELK